MFWNSLGGSGHSFEAVNDNCGFIDKFMLQVVGVKKIYMCM